MPSLARCNEHPHGHPEVREAVKESKAGDGTTMVETVGFGVKCSHCPDVTVLEKTQLEAELAWNAGAKDGSTFALSKKDLAARQMALLKTGADLEKAREDILSQIRPLEATLAPLNGQIRDLKAELGETTTG